MNSDIDYVDEEQNEVIGLLSQEPPCLSCHYLERKKRYYDNKWGDDLRFDEEMINDNQTMNNEIIGMISIEI